MNRLEEAVTKYHEAIKRDPDMLAAPYNLGLVLNKQQEFGQAVLAFQRAIELNPMMGEAHNNLGVALKGLGLEKEAMDEFRAAIKANPDLAPPHYNLGRALQEEGSPDQAISEYREAIRINPDYSSAHNSLGVALDKQGKTDAAIAAFRLAFESAQRVLGPQHPGTQEAKQNLVGLSANRSWALATAANESERDPQRAVELARLAADLEPDVANQWNNLGVALYRWGDFRSALAAFEQADGMLDGRDREHRLFLAMAHWRLGHDERARKFYGQGAAWVVTQAVDNEEEQRFLGEAEQLMGIDLAQRAALIEKSSGPATPDLQNGN